MQRISMFIIISILSLSFLQAQELQTPMPSPLGTVTQIVGLTEISITYSRPGVKGREIFGELVPFDKLWRTGANMSTKLKLDDNVMLEGKELPAGEYALFTIPGKKEWTIIISKNIGPGTSKYKMEDDVLRFSAKSGIMSEPVERFTIEFADMTDNSANIMLKWAKTRVSFGLMVDTDSKVMGLIDQVMKDPEQADANILYRAGSYYFTNDKDTKQALKWVSRAVELKPEAFWMSRVKAQIQAKMGDYESAIKTAELSMKEAEKAGNQQYVVFNQDAITEWQAKK